MPITHKARFELLERRLLLAFDPTGIEQEMLEYANHMRIDPQGALGVLFTSIDPLISPDTSVNIAMDYWSDPSSAEIQADWALLQPTDPLAWNESLYDAAYGHGELMIQYDQQSHQLPDEPALGDRITNAGYESWSHVAENVFAYAESAFYGHSGFAIDWAVPNRGHRTTLMSPDYQEVGIAVLSQDDPGMDLGPLVVTQDFGSRWNSGDPYLLGVVFDDANDNQRYDAGEGCAGIDIQVAGAAGVFNTTTMSAGGYQLTVPSGTYTVTASGGPLILPIVETDVVVGSANVKVDFQPADIPVDFGDAPGPNYGTLLNNNGARHGIVAGFHLGDGIDDESDGQPNATATGDDAAGIDDEDGVTFNADFVLGATTSITVNASAPGMLDAWIDFNRDGDWNDAGEKIFASRSLAAGDNDLSVLVPVTARPGNAFARFRFSSAGGLSVGGSAADGEVEDYALQIAAPSDLVNGVLTLAGDGGDDTFEFTAGTTTHTVVLNGQVRSYPAADVNTVVFDGGLGNDTATVTGAAGNETGELWPGIAHLVGAALRIDVSQTETITLNGGGGSDVVTFFNSPSKDEFIGHSGWASMTGPGMSNSAAGFGMIYAYGSPANGDIARLYDSPHDDFFVATSSYGGLYVEGNEVISTRYFKEVYGYADNAGFDTAKFYDSPVDDLFTSTAAQCTMENGSYYREANSFENVHAYATSTGNDVAVMYDGVGDDTFVATGVDGIMVGQKSMQRAKWFEEVYAWAVNDGYNYAKLYDTANDDTFVAHPDVSTLYGDRVQGGTYKNEVHDFDAVHAYAWAGGYDMADLYGSAGADTYYGSPVEGAMWSNIGEYWNRAKNFEEVRGHGVGDNDTANLFDSALADLLQAEETPGGDRWAKLSNASLQYAHWVSDFAKVKVTGSNSPNDTKQVDAVYDWLEIQGTWEDL